MRTVELLTKILQGVYIIIFVLSITMIGVMHTIPAPAFAVFRIPTQLREVGPVLGLTWSTTLEVYHAFLLLFFAVIILNGIGLYRLHIDRWRSVCRISSFLGIFLIWSVFLFFIFPLTLNGSFNTKNLQTFLVYSLLAFVFLVTDILTFATTYGQAREDKLKSFAEKKEVIV